MAEQIKMFGVNTPGGPWHIALVVGPEFPQRGEGDPLLNFGTSFLSPERQQPEI